MFSTCKNWTKRCPHFLQRETDARIVINLLDLIEEDRPLSPMEHHLRFLTSDTLHLSIRERWVYWRARAKIRFALEGDENTSYFHALASCRKRRNAIPIIDHDGQSFSGHADKAKALEAFFRNLLGTAMPCSWNFRLRDLYPTPNALPASLTATFSSSEIVDALSHMNKDSSPGPDGFDPCFFSTF